MTNIKYTTGDPCPDCKHPLEFVTGHDASYDDPGQDPCLFCTECGCESHDIDWDAWDNERGIFWRLTDEQRKQLDALELKIDEQYPQPTKDDAVTWDELFEHAPAGDFKWDAEEAGDWTPWEDDPPTGWTQTAYVHNMGRKNGKRWIECRSVDRDGNWDFDWGLEDNDNGTPPNDAAEYLVLMHCHHQLRAVAKYYVYVARTGDDCLDDYYYPKNLNPKEAVKSLENFLK
jgi:hypothetical protein|tara:strand:+ start:534 stop:1223 length:690 start_codon:yes stop_codon:yes gene_type:complete